MNKVKKFLYSQKAAPYVFILPFVLTVILFWVFPIANGVLLSFQDVLKDKWVGMNNYKRLLSDTYFRKAVWNSFKYMVGTLVLLIPFPMLFASMLNSKLMKAKGFFKSVYFIPALTSVVVVGTIFRLMFGEMDTALANQILNFFGHSSIKWLKGEWTGYFALLLVACWRWTGVNILYFLAGLQNISTDLYEAASIDGATKWQQFKSISVPLVKPTTIYVLTILICITKISTFLILCDLAVCLATLYVSFSLVFALMRYLQGKVFLIRFYSPTTLSSSRAEFRLPSRLACA